MQYKELREMTAEEWDGKSFEAYAVDSEDASISHPTVREVVGYRIGLYPWQCENVRYKHVYPVKWNEEKVKDALKPKKRMTNRQLAKWLADNRGELRTCLKVNVFHDHQYYCGTEDLEVEVGYKVRKWDSEEWIEPTVDLLENAEND